MKKKKNKYIYYKVLQGFYYGWEDLTFYNTSDPSYLKELKDDLKAYRENEKTSFRVIERRVLNS